mgnify:CR=1 FL=1
MNTDDMMKKNGQFVLSYELLALLRWLAENDTDKLKKIIGKSLTAGLSEELQKIDQTEESELLEYLQHGITDFLSTMESLLLEVISEHVQKKARHQKLLPAIDQIDSTMCDDSTVKYSLEKATSVMDNDPKANARDTLFKELLRRWQPIDKNTKN